MPDFARSRFWMGRDIWFARRREDAKRAVKAWRVVLFLMRYADFASFTITDAPSLTVMTLSRNGFQNPFRPDLHLALAIGAAPL
jgi:hypothetical protein